ncbi:DUF3267 domain-containing protein [Capillibacterium thermochitinicola]|nr:DUF3267 domain-containing protein [Capillibacterium thermochitinicola]
MLKANLVAFVMAFPIALVLYLLYLVVNGTGQQGSGPRFLFIVLFLLGIVLHELIHGAVFAAFAKDKWRAVRFGIHWPTLTPYCSCVEALSLPKYVLICAMPTIIFGLLPYFIGLAFGLSTLAYFGLLFIFAGGGDAYILWMIRKERQGLILDHPYLVGCVVFSPKLSDSCSTPVPAGQRSDVNLN